MNIAEYTAKYDILLLQTVAHNLFFTSTVKFINSATFVVNYFTFTTYFIRFIRGIQNRWCRYSGTLYYRANS